MKFSTILLAVAASVVSTMAVPAPEPEPVAEPAEVEKRANSIYVCGGKNWGAPCVSKSPPWNQCQSWGSLGLSGMRSWGPDQGVWCIWYNKPCGAPDATASDTFTYPGFSDLPSYWMYNTQSYKCWW